MNVKDLMSREVRSVRMTDRLDAAARVMWEQDCGLCPVVDSGNVLVGVVTDRDLCMASYTQGKALLDIPVTSVMARGLRTAKPDDAAATALATLQQAQLHRLPVVDARGVLVGVLSISDLARGAQAKPTLLDGGTVLKAITSIRAPRRQAAAAPVAPAVVMPTPPAAKPTAPAAALATAAKPATLSNPSAPKSALAAPATKPGKQKGKGKKG